MIVLQILKMFVFLIQGTEEQQNIEPSTSSENWNILLDRRLLFNILLFMLGPIRCCFLNKKKKHK